MNHISKNSSDNFYRQRGFILPLTGLIIFAIFTYTLVVMSYAANATRKVELYNNVLDALNAAVNASPGLTRIVGNQKILAEMDLFEAACHTLKSTMFFGVGGNFPCTVATFLPTTSNPTGRLVTYGSVASPLATDDGKLTCEQVTFSYESANPAQVGSRQKFCIEITCNKQSGFIPQSLISKVGASSCISAGQTVTYVGLDISDNWSNTYRDCIRSDGSNCLPQSNPLSTENVYVDKPPPGLVVMGNSKYFDNSATPTSAIFYTDPAGTRQYSSQMMVNQLRDMQAPGLSSYLQSNTGKLQVPGGANSIELPFEASEFDFNEVSSQFTVAYPAQLRSDNMSDDVMASLPYVLNSHSRDLFATGVAVADHTGYHHYVPQLDVFQPHGIESTMMHWFYQDHASPLMSLSPTTVTPTWGEFPLLQTRGGFLTSHAQTMACFNPFWMVGKSVAEQLIYDLSNKQQRAGLALISQIVIPGAPVLPEALVASMAAAGTPLDPANMPLAGPDPTLQTGGYQGRDFILEQFGDSSAAIEDQVNYQNALLMGHIKNVCWSNITHEYVAGVPRRFRALQNPYDPFTVIEPPRWPNYQQNFGGDSNTVCPNPVMPQMNGGSYYPILSGQPNTSALFNHPNGLCYDNTDDLVTGLNLCSANYYTQTANLTDVACRWRSDNPGWPLPPSSSPNNGNCLAGDAYLRSGRTVEGTDPTYQSSLTAPNFIRDIDIDASFRWCPNTPPTGYGVPSLPLAIQSISSGNFTFRSNGFSTFYNPLDPKNNTPLAPGSLFTNLEFPYRSNGPERAVPAALLGMIRALRNPEIVGAFDAGAIVLILNGLPEVSIHRTIADSGAMQSTLTIPPPRAGELPDYNTGFVNYNGQMVDLNATFESLHLIHAAVSQGIRVSVILIQSDLSDPRVDIFRAGLRPPNNAATASTPYHSFCLPTSLAGSAIGNMPAATQTCNPTNDPPTAGITLVDLVKQPFPQTYTQFNQAALNELGTVALYNLAKYKLSK